VSSKEEIMDYKSNTLSKYLLHEQTLVILPGLAEVIGLNEAIFVQQLHFLIQLKLHQANKDNYIDDKIWVYNTYLQWKNEYFKFWSESTVKRTIVGLVLDGYVIKDNHNIDKRDQRLWYTINYFKLDESLKEHYEKQMEEIINKLNREP